MALPGDPPPPEEIRRVRLLSGAPGLDLRFDEKAVAAFRA
jgi:hypothetical protein